LEEFGHLAGLINPRRRFESGTRHEGTPLAAAGKARRCPFRYPLTVNERIVNPPLLVRVQVPEPRQWLVSIMAGAAILSLW
jgi:hypothetical protein